MKKVIAILVILTMAACGGAATEVSTDSTAAQIDSAAGIVDSTVAQIAADSVGIK